MEEIVNELRGVRRALQIFHMALAGDLSTYQAALLLMVMGERREYPIKEVGEVTRVRADLLLRAAEQCEAKGWITMRKVKSPEGGHARAALTITDAGVLYMVRQVRAARRWEEELAAAKLAAADAPPLDHNALRRMRRKARQRLGFT